MYSAALCCEILAIRCIEKFVIASIGNQLNIFDELTKKQLQVIDTFHVDNIHEIIRINEDRLIVFGGRSISVFQFQIKNDTIILEKISNDYFNDWIIAASSILFNDNENICILFAHNNLCIYNILTKNIENIWCEEKCILYAGNIFTNNSDEIVIFSGTVFQEILIWKINCKKKYFTDVPVLHRLKGHKGVIFSIYYDQFLNLITTTSDDRTIRIWEIRDETDKSLSSLNWDNIAINLKFSIFGHTARVWKSIVVNNHIISIGEDSLICIWTLNGELYNKILAHGGATIWSICASEDKSIIFTGGADGALNSWPITHNQSILTPTLTFDKKKTPKYICYMDSGLLIIFLDGGELLSYNNHTLLPIDSINLSRYQSYCVMKISLDRKKIALASNDGYLDIFEKSSTEFRLKFSKESEKIMDSKIFSLQWLNDKMILVCGSQGHLIVIKIEQNKTFNIQSEFILPSSRGNWTTTGITVGNLLICGDRTGSIYIFSIKSNYKKDPVQFFSKIHGRLGVQSLGIIEKKLISTGRDGSLRFYKILDEKNHETRLQTLHWKKMPMDWVSGTLKIRDDFYVLGFKEIEFIIYSTRLNRVISRVVCGGGHRSWDCIFTNNMINFAYIRNKQIHALNNVLCTFSDSLITGYHTKEIPALECLFTTTNHNIFVTGSEDCTFGIAWIEKSTDNKYNIKPLETYDGHISNVKSIAVINIESNNEYTRNIVFTGGGRAQLKVWEITIDTNKKKLSYNDLTVIEKTAFMLRGTDKVRQKKWSDNKQPFFMDPETRFMNIRANFHPSNNNFIILFVACSDGYIRIILYDIESNNLKLITGIPYNYRCIIKIHTFHHLNKLILMSMATDGFINFWSMNSTIEKIFVNSNKNCITPDLPLEPFEKWKAHQSGINSYDFRQNKKNEYYLATGGDDNKVNLSVFTIELCKFKQISMRILATWNSVFIHSAQITGIQFVDDNKMLSAAIDQKIVMFHYTYDNSILSVLPMKTIMTFVSDVQGIKLFNSQDGDKKLTCVYGKGIEVISINK